MRLKQWILRMFRNPLIELFREYSDIRDAAKHWTVIKCWQCELPAASPEAQFCTHCGAVLCEPPLYVQLRNVNTEPMQRVPDTPHYVSIRSGDFMKFYHGRQAQGSTPGPHTLRIQAVRLNRATKGKGV